MPGCVGRQEPKRSDALSLGSALEAAHSRRQDSQISGNCLTPRICFPRAVRSSPRPSLPAAPILFLYIGQNEIILLGAPNHPFERWRAGKLVRSSLSGRLQFYKKERKR
jgi:hypothetical protein